MGFLTVEHESASRRGVESASGWEAASASQWRVERTRYAQLPISSYGRNPNPDPVSCLLLQTQFVVLGQCFLPRTLCVIGLVDVGSDESVSHRLVNREVVGTLEWRNGDRVSAVRQ